MTAYRTIVDYSPPSPLGLIPGRWTIQHWCTTCRTPIPTEGLIAHAQTHDETLPSDTVLDRSADPVHHHRRRR